MLTAAAVALERRLSIDHGDEILSILTGDSETADVAAADARAASSASEGSSPILASPCQQQQIWDEIHVQVPPMTPTSIPLSFSTFKFPPTPPSPPKSTFVDDLMRADLYVTSEF